MLTSTTKGLLYILLTVVIWTAAGFATQWVMTTGDFSEPFLFTYISSALFTVNIPIFLMGQWLSSALARQQEKFESAEQYYQHRDVVLKEELSVPDESTWLTQKSVTVLPPSPLPNVLSTWLFRPLAADSTVEMLAVAAALSPLLFLGNYLYNYSLIFTSVSSSIVITNLNGAFTLLFSTLCGVENVTWNKLGGVFLCLMGVVLVGQGDRVNEKVSGDTYELYGDLCAMGGAICYGLYTTLIKLKIPEQNEGISITLLFGFMGLTTFLFFIPYVAWLFVSQTGGTQKLTPSMVGFILGEEMLDSVLANYLYARAAILAAPSVAAVGESLTIPLSIIAQAVLFAMDSPFAGDGGVISTWNICGGILVTLGFALLVIE